MNWVHHPRSSSRSLACNSDQTGLFFLREVCLGSARSCERVLFPVSKPTKSRGTHYFASLTSNASNGCLLATAIRTVFVHGTRISHVTTAAIGDMCSNCAPRVYWRHVVHWPDVLYTVFHWPYGAVGCFPIACCSYHMLLVQGDGGKGTGGSRRE